MADEHPTTWSKIYSQRYYQENKAWIVERTKANYLKNRDARIEKRRAYYAANKDKIAAKSKTYRERTLEARKAYSRDYYLKNKATVRAKNEKWKKDNPQRFAELTRSWQAKNPLKLQASAHKYQKLPAPTRPEPSLCECCGKPPTKKHLVLDHCHATNEFRGWICYSCNVGLGHLGDNLEGVRKALSYLELARPKL